MNIMNLQSQSGCILSIGQFPQFNYDAKGGGAHGTISPTDQKHIKRISFDPKNLLIPSLNGKSTKFLGLPLPPGLDIAIYTNKLEGKLYIDSGEIQLDFEAKFKFTIIKVIKAPDLSIQTNLNSKAVMFNKKVYKGKGLDSNGYGTLVGVSIVPKSGNIFLDTFLGLPNKALAVLNIKINNIY